jgi:hypothetical protein
MAKAAAVLARTIAAAKIPARKRKGMATSE